MEEKPLVSVIIPVYRDWACLAHCLDALAGQTYPHELIEVVVVDNEGRDDQVQHYGSSSGVAVVQELEPGSYAARNRGVRASSGVILAFTDADCIPTAGWIEGGVEAFRSSPGVGRVAGAIELIYKDARSLTAVELYERVFAFRQEQAVKDRGTAVTANMFTFSEVFREVGPFRIGTYSGADLEWGRRAERAGFRIVYAPEARVLHPARHSWKSIIAKTRRLTGGQRTLRRGGTRQRSPRFGRLRQALASPFPRNNLERLKVISVLVVLKMVRTGENLRLALGGSPYRD